MRRPAGVIIAAVILGLMAVGGIFGGLVSVGVSIFMQMPTNAAMPGERGVMIATTGLMLCFFLFCAWTVVGLLQMRVWARYSILVLGGLLFLVSAVACIAMIFMRNVIPMPPTAAPSPVNFQGLFIGFLLAFYGSFSLVGAWWLVYFNLAPVRAAFSGAGTPAGLEGAAVSRVEMPGAVVGDVRTAAPVAVAPKAAVPGWRIVIIVWACLLLFSIVGLPMMLVLHPPLFLFGAILRGSAAMTWSLVFVALQIYLGVGLLKKWRAAWYLGVVWQIYTIAFYLAFLVPGVWTRFMAYEQEVMGHWISGVSAPNVAVVMSSMGPLMRVSMAFGGIVGVAIVVVLSVALIQRREDYLGAS